MKYPIGIQTFSEIREKGFVYVDKTAYVYRMADEGKYYFLSRPRRFGKSLLLSTIEAYFQGRRELFDGLDIERLEKEWVKYPVLHFDLNIGSYTVPDGTLRHLNSILGTYEKRYGCPAGYDQTIGARFAALIDHIHTTTGRQVVILVDEYDKPLLETIGNPDLQEAHRAALKPFYGCLKTCDAMIRFAMLTGVTKFGHLSVFSDLNNLIDISLDDDFAAICGITTDEITSGFDDVLTSFAHKSGLDKTAMLAALKKAYNGYRFSGADVTVFNPFSLLNAFRTLKISDFWFKTGTPTYLVRLMQQYGKRVLDLDRVRVPSTTLESVDPHNSDPVPVIYQSGYLTIKDYDPVSELFTLGFPNTEVRKGFLLFLLPYYTGETQSSGVFTVNQFVEDIEQCRVPDFIERLQSLFADTPYSANKDYEYYYQDILYVVFRLMGLRVQCEYHTHKGRIDLVVKTREYIYVMEFKFGSTAEDALRQIHEKGYAEPFLADPREKILIGINFSPDTRNIDGYSLERF